MPSTFSENAITSKPNVVSGVSSRNGGVYILGSSYPISLLIRGLRKFRAGRESYHLRFLVRLRFAVFLAFGYQLDH